MPRIAAHPRIPAHLALTLACLGLVDACGDAGAGTPSTSTATTDDTTTTDDPTTTDATTSSSPTSSTSSPSSTSASETTATDPAVDATTADTTTADTTAADTTTADTTAGSTGDTSTGSTGSTDDTTGDPGDCSAAELVHAPPVTPKNGLTAVPIDIQDLDATVTIDAVTETAAATAAMTFRLGPDGGHPVFDLRQTILTADLDGEPVDPALLAEHTFFGGPDAQMRILAVELEPCSEHVLTLTYALTKPTTLDGKGMQWEEGRVKWDFYFSDLDAGRYLESWFPANLIHDRFAVALDLELTGSPVAHVLATNGVEDPVGPGHWRISWPATSTALSQMLVLIAGDRIKTESSVVDLIDGTQLDLEVWVEDGIPFDPAEFVPNIVGYFDEYIATVGPYAHGDRFVAYYWSEYSNHKEYDGAMTTYPGATDHEVFHSWWGRSLKPATQNHGWIDEAWTTHLIDAGANETPLDFTAPPVFLWQPNPWIRATPLDSFHTGERVFAGIAAMVGAAALQDAMRGFYVEHTGELITTAELERHLYCTLNEPGVRAAFHRFVRGQDSDPPPPPPGYCG